MTEEASPRRRFGARADAYVASPVHAAPRELALLVAAAVPAPSWTVLDVATGGGHTALAFAAHVRRVVASDLTPEMVAAARRHVETAGAANVAFCAARAEHLPFAARAFDAVTCRIAPHHFDDVRAFATEAARVLRPGGALVVQDHVLPDDPPTASWIDDFERARDPSHRRALRRAEWPALLEDAGLSVTSSEEIAKRHRLAPWAERQGAAVEPLRAALVAAPEPVTVWLQPRDLAGEDASFENRHLVIAARKGM